MNSEQANRLQELLEEACDHYLEYDNGKIIHRRFFDSEGGQCPLTCLFGPVSMKVMAEETNSLLGISSVSDDELRAFVFAFDGMVMPEYYEHFVSASLIGKTLREKYIQETRHPL
jgi:hypothetical protein